MSRNKKSIRTVWLGMMIFILIGGLLTACGKEKGNNTQDVSGEQQLGTPDNGDTIAIFHVKEYGDIHVRFFEKAASKAVENFVTHAKEGYYDGVIFHRVINDFMIQGGDPTGTGTGGKSIWGKEFENECVDDLLPIRGALCMANRGADTNGSQFFIVQAKEAVINSTTTLGMSDGQIQFFKENGGCPHLAGSFTVFGQVIEGMDVVDAIASAEADDNDKPVKDVIIESIEITSYAQ